MCVKPICPFKPKSQLLYLTLAIIQGFGSMGGCLGLGLKRVETESVSRSKLKWECVGMVGSHLLGCRAGLEAEHEEPWTAPLPCPAEGLCTKRELLGSAGRGFWGGLGFPSSCFNTCQSSKQGFPLGGTHTQTYPFAFCSFRQQGIPVSATCDEKKLSCGFNLL